MSAARDLAASTLGGITDGGSTPQERSDDSRPETEVGAARPGRTLDTGDFRTVHNVRDRDLADLDAREQEVLRLAFGLSGGEPMRYAAIGEKLGGISYERVRQIRNLALHELQMGVDHDWPRPGDLTVRRDA